MKRLLLALAAALAALEAAAAEPQWILASNQPAVETGERFELLVVAPRGAEALPDTLAARIRADTAEFLVELEATGPESEGRRPYAASMPPAAYGPVSLSLAERSSNVLVLRIVRHDAMQALTGPFGGTDQEPPVSENDPMYIVFGARGGYSARFQLSFKYRLFDYSTGFGRDQPWLAGFYFGYTQNSLWDLSSESKAFRDTNYRPSLFWRWQRSDAATWVDAWRLGFEHESNGRESPRSRSINTVFTRPEWHWKIGERRLEFTPKFYAYTDKEENPDIAHYRGYVDWRLRVDSGGVWIGTAVLRYGTSGKGSLLLDLARRTRDLKIGPVSGYLHAQFFAGYGEDIIDYNFRRKSQLRLGVAIVP